VVFLFSTIDATDLCFVYKPFLTKSFRSFGMLYCATEWLFSEISKDCSAFFFRVNSLKLLFDPFTLQMMVIWSFGTLRSIYHTTKIIIPEDLNFNHHCCQKVKPHTLSFIFITSALKVETMFLEICDAPFTATKKKMMNNCVWIAAALHTVL
jgi:hypothetical protein